MSLTKISTIYQLTLSLSFNNWVGNNFKHMSLLKRLTNGNIIHLMWIFGNGKFRYEPSVFSIEINENKSCQNQCANESVSSERGCSTYTKTNGQVILLLHTLKPLNAYRSTWQTIRRWRHRIPCPIRGVCLATHLVQSFVTVAVYYEQCTSSKPPRRLRELCLEKK